MGNQWKSMKINRKSMKINENQRKSIENLWKSMKINRKSMKIDENQWKSVKTNENQSQSFQKTRFLGKSRKPSESCFFNKEFNKEFSSKILIF